MNGPDTLNVVIISIGLLVLNTVKPVLNGISRVQKVFLLKPGFSLIKVYCDSHGTLKYFRLRQNSV
jgi:hypothetical protein